MVEVLVTRGLCLVIPLLTIFGSAPAAIAAGQSHEVLAQVQPPRTPATPGRLPAPPEPVPTDMRNGVVKVYVDDGTGRPTALIRALPSEEDIAKNLMLLHQAKQINCTATPVVHAVHAHPESYDMKVGRYMHLSVWARCGQDSWRFELWATTDGEWWAPDLGRRLVMP